MSSAGSPCEVPIALSSHPHWLTWAPIDWPRLDFHRKELFGFLELGG